MEQTKALIEHITPLMHVPDFQNERDRPLNDRGCTLITIWDLALSRGHIVGAIYTPAAE